MVLDCWCFRRCYETPYVSAVQCLSEVLSGSVPEGSLASCVSIMDMWILDGGIVRYDYGLEVAGVRALRSVRVEFSQ